MTTLTAVVIDSWAKLATYIVVALAGVLLYFVGCLVFRGRNEGGIRLVLFAVGILASVLGGAMVYHLWPDLIIHNYPKALLAFLGAIFLALGTALLFVSVFGSSQRVRKWFDAILRGFDFI